MKSYWCIWDKREVGFPVGNCEIVTPSSNNLSMPDIGDIQANIRVFYSDKRDGNCAKQHTYSSVDGGLTFED